METITEASQVCELEHKICEQLSWENAKIFSRLVP